MDTKDLKEFILINGELYHRGTGGVLIRALSQTEAKDELHQIHDLLCGENEIILYRHMQRQGILLA